MHLFAIFDTYMPTFTDHLEAELEVVTEVQQYLDMLVCVFNGC